jgi:alpha-L-rhamnosidase/Glycosyl hydrolases family 2, sugar binding domain
VREFLSPPSTARPLVWWHWVNGNITKEGIKLDLEWMHRVGIGGVQTFDAAFDAPTLVDGRLAFMTPPWRDAFRSATALADKFGMDFAIAGSPGWSESGGPWVKPEQAMKKLVWTETRVRGGVRYSGKLPQPPGNLGPFQDFPVAWGPEEFAGPPSLRRIPDLYKDVAVVAYRLPAEDSSMAELRPVVTSSAGVLDGDVLWDGRFSRAVHLPYGKQGEPAWIQIDFRHPQIIQSMTLGLQEFEGASVLPKHVGAFLESSVDGVKFHRVATAYDTAEYTPQAMPPIAQTVTFPPVTARYFRLLLPRLPALQVSRELESLLPRPPVDQQVTEFVLSRTPRVDRFEYKAGYFLDSGIVGSATAASDSHEAINPKDVVDLTGRLREDGSINWAPPVGHWAILRIGYSLLGIMNHPASPEGTGLEVDKLSRSAVKAYMEDYLEHYRSALGPQLMGSRGLRAMVSDSYEAGPQNWTDELPEEFARRRGYELRLWMPALTGRIIRSPESTDRFLWDFRRTLEELLSENHYGQITDSLHAGGMTHYGEAHEINRAFIGDGMDVKRKNDIPMAAMWVPGFLVTQEQGDADIRESASVAHIYGQNLVAAESMTAFGTAETAYAYVPETLKPTADRELADGVNLFVIHTSAHQPLIDRPPGVTLGPFGQWFTRNETWAELAGPWITYLARSSYLMQQGTFVADVVYYYGQDSNITALYSDHLPPVPEGYAFDFANAHALSMLSVRDGYLTTTSGMRYRILALDSRSRLMSLDVLQRIAQLVRAGATVVGARPEATPSLADNSAAFRALAAALWGEGMVGDRRYGAGRILFGMSLADAIAAVGLAPDFSYSKSKDDTAVWYVHRKTLDADIYFVSNRQERPEEITARFRVSHKLPELWHADSGVMEPASYRQERDRTDVRIKLAAHDAVFVIFRDSTSEPERRVVEETYDPLGIIEGPWQVHFQLSRGAPAQATFTELIPWNAHSDLGIRYFSGTASYETTFEISASWLVKNRRVEIDLGAVKNLAEIIINGRTVGVLWKAPFRIDITPLLRVGPNQLDVRVTNLWPNRLIGDKQPGAQKIASVTYDPFKSDSPLVLSGLLGPVTLIGVSAH